jgi:uncharacterized repeat protein (TIGR01451 family)
VGPTLTLTSCGALAGVTLLAEQKDLTPKAAPNSFKTVQITVSNPSASVARGVTVRDTLPGGFSFVSTTSGDWGDAIRTQTIEPGIRTPSPTWGTWSIPPGSRAHPAKLILEFEVAIGHAPVNTPNFVQVNSESADPVAAKPIPLSVQPAPIVDLTVTSRTPVAAGSVAQYTIQLRNSGSSAADGVFVSASLPTGFLFNTTSQTSGNSLRSEVTDPIANSLLPSWGSWAIPPQQQDGSPGVLRIVFTARVATDEPPGTYPISVTVTYKQLASAQTATDQAPVTVQK